MLSHGRRFNHIGGFLAVAIGLLGATFDVRTAQACFSAFICTPTSVGARPPLHVPASLGFIPAPHDADQPASNATDVALFDASGDRLKVPTNTSWQDNGALLFRPALTAGHRFRLEYPANDCLEGGERRQVSRDVEITEPRAMPKKMGTLRLRSHTVVEVERHVSCEEPVKEVVVTDELVFEPSEELRPFLDATLLTVTESGVDHAPSAQHYRALSATDVATITRSGKCSTSGVTRYTVHAKIIGVASEVADETIDVERECPDDAGCATGPGNSHATGATSACLLSLGLLVAARARVSRRSIRRCNLV